MNPIREISMTLMKAAIVTVAVVLGFCAGSALGLPVWLQAVFLVPAMLLFYRLSGQRRPPIWKMIGFAGLLSVFVLLISLGSKYVPEQYFWYYYMLILLIAPFGPILNGFERRFFPKEHKSEQSAPVDDDGGIAEARRRSRELAENPAAGCSWEEIRRDLGR